MMKRHMLGLVVLGLLVSPGLAAIIHDGQTNPTTEGWALIHSGGGTVGAGTDEKAYWATNATSMPLSGYVGYRVDNTATLNEIMDNAGGWKMSATVKVVTPGPTGTVNEPFFGVRDPSTWWSLSMIDTGSPTTTGVYIQLADTTAQLVHAVDISAYHTYDMIYNPTADAVSVSVDGGSASVYGRSEIIAVSGSRQINFGDFNGSAGGALSHWNQVEFSSVPEPATMALLAIGGCGVLLRRRRA